MGMGCKAISATKAAIMKKKLLVSVSGGRTSGLMAKLIFDSKKLNTEYDIVYVFANTSREKEQTLIFVNNLTAYFGIPIIWVEAVIHPETGEGTTHKIISYETAQRDGQVLEAVIKKYGIPCSKTPVCTRESKKYCINSFIRSIGWNLSETLIAIGYRADEPKRIDLEKAQKYNHWYPLYEWQIRKSDVAVFWNKQVFDLGLIDAEGNCKVCFKKSDEKILFQLMTEPIDAKWIYSMEQKYGEYTPREKTDNAPYRFFRHKRLLNEIVEQYPNFDPLYLIDNSLSENGSEYDFDLKEQEDCAESCEPFQEFED